MSEIEVDTTRLNDALASLQEALGEAGKPADASDITRDETRRLAGEIVKMMPPQTQAVGINAVRRDVLGSLFSGASEGMINEIGSREGLVNVDTWHTNQKGERVRLVWGTLDPTGARMKERHFKALDTRGHAPRPTKNPKGEWRARNVVPYEARKAYAKKVEAHVGRLKATWARTAQALGASVTRWISRHISAGMPNSVSDTKGLMDGANPSVTFGSRAKGVGRQAAAIRSATRARVESIKRRVRLIVSGYSKDLARGMKAQRRAKSTGQGGRYVVG